jgi:single-stranded-DNA-specific exonuclease
MKKWIYKAPPENLVKELSSGLEISKTCAMILANRVSSLEEAKEFLKADLSGLNNPFLLPDIEKAIDRIKLAIDKKEKILIYGDRDVDGVSSVCIMIKTLSSLGADVVWYVPAGEGYGLNSEIIDTYKKQDIKLIITVDCGITGDKEIEHAKTLGIDVVVTDHHEPSQGSLPKAIAVVDPKIKTSKYPFSSLAGCAVAFKVCEALMLSFGKYYNVEMTAVDLEGSSESVEGVLGIALTKFKNFLVSDKLEFNFNTFDEQAFAKLCAFIGSSKLVFKNADIGLKALKYFADKAGKKLYSSSIVDLNPFKDDISTLKDSFSAFVAVEQKKDLRMRFFENGNFDIVALGTIADIMPLKNENRILVKEGLKNMSVTKNFGIRSLLESCLYNKAEMNAKAISWNVTPMLNAAGRCGKADLSAKLLLAKDKYEADGLFDKIKLLNDQRKKLQTKNIAKFMALAAEQCDLEKDKILVVTAENLEHGVTGIVASHLVRNYSRPALLFIVQGNEATGAVRSVEGVDIIKILGRLSDIIVKYGGHTKAAGLTVSLDKLAEFKERLKKIADEEISEDLLIPKIELDAELDADEVSLKLIKEINELEPFGCENPQPVFSLRNIQIVDKNLLGADGGHVKFGVSKDGGKILKILGWGMGKTEFKINDMVDVAVTLELEVYNGTKSPRLVIVDMKLADK